MASLAFSHTYTDTQALRRKEMITQALLVKPFFSACEVLQSEGTKAFTGSVFSFLTRRKVSCIQSRVMHGLELISLPGLLKPPVHASRVARYFLQQTNQTLGFFRNEHVVTVFLNDVPEQKLASSITV